MMSVMVAEDSLEQNTNFCEFLTKDKDIEVVSRTLDGPSTVEQYIEKKPDVLVLDLKLPGLSGIDVIDNLSLDSSEKNKCNIIIVSGHTDLRINLFNTSKIYRIMPKPVDYDTLKETIKEIGETSEILTQKEIKDLLFDFKFNIYSKGARYITDAIQFAYKDINLLSNITELYKLVAFINEEKVNKIQRSIRSSIDTMNSHISKEQLRSFFHVYNNDIITPKYFFTIVVDYFRELKGK